MYHIIKGELPPKFTIRRETEEQISRVNVLRDEMELTQKEFKEANAALQDMLEQDQVAAIRANGGEVEVDGLECARTACQSRRAVCYHTQTGKMYCRACAHAINYWNPGLVVFPSIP